VHLTRGVVKLGKVVKSVSIPPVLSMSISPSDIILENSQTPLSKESIFSIEILRKGLQESYTNKFLLITLLPSPDYKFADVGFSNKSLPDSNVNPIMYISRYSTRLSEYQL